MNSQVAPIKDSPNRFPKPFKGYKSATGIRNGYRPNGSGRDLSVFSDPECIPSTGVIFSSVSPSPKAKSILIVSQPRSEPPPRLTPNGSGRDLFQLSQVGLSIVPHTGIVFSPVAPASKKKPAALRTSPPPRFSPSGSGRDTFCDTEFSQMHYPTQIKTRHKATAASTKAQSSRMATLSRPRSAPVTGRTSGFVGLLIPGSNLRREIKLT